MTDHSQEIVLSILPGDSDRHRVVLLHRASFGNSAVLLRRESFSEAVGWFEQSSIELSPDQVGHLKQALGSVPMSRARPAHGQGRGCRAAVCPPASDEQVASISMWSQNVG